MNPTVLADAVIRKPLPVDPLTMGPLIYPRDPQPWQQPIWGRTVRTLRGKSAIKARVLRKPRSISDPFDPGGRTAEPDGTRGSSWVEYLLVLRACWRAGWTLDQVLYLLEDDPQIGDRTIGACAQHTWQRFYKGDRWEDQIWGERIILGEIRGYYRHQVDHLRIKTVGHTTDCPTGGNQGSVIHPETGEVRGQRLPSGFVVWEEPLQRLRGWMEAHPDLSQTDLIEAQWVIHGKARRGSVVDYLREMERRGLATWEPRHTGKRGQPAKVWRVLLTPAEIAQRDQWEAEARERQPFDLEDLLGNLPGDTTARVGTED